MECEPKNCSGSENISILIEFTRIFSFFTIKAVDGKLMENLIKSIDDKNFTKRLRSRKHF